MNIQIVRAGRALAILAIAFLANNIQAQDKKDTTKTSTTVTETFIVSDMGCATDSKMVETALYRKKGVKSVRINGDQVTITYDKSKVKREDLVKAIENTGTCEDPNAKVHKVKLKT